MILRCCGGRQGEGGRGLACRRAKVVCRHPAENRLLVMAAPGYDLRAKMELRAHMPVQSSCTYGQNGCAAALRGARAIRSAGLAAAMAINAVAEGMFKAADCRRGRADRRVGDDMPSSGSGGAGQPLPLMTMPANAVPVSENLVVHVQCTGTHFGQTCAWPSLMTTGSRTPGQQRSKGHITQPDYPP